MVRIGLNIHEQAEEPKASITAAAASSSAIPSTGATPKKTGKKETDSSSNVPALSGADKQKFDKKVRDLERKVELYQKQDSAQKTEVCIKLTDHC